MFSPEGAVRHSLSLTTWQLLVKVVVKYIRRSHDSLSIVVVIWHAVGQSGVEPVILFWVARDACGNKKQAQPWRLEMAFLGGVHLT